MSHLWPEKVVGGLFPGQCWLKLAGAQEAHALAQPGIDAPQAILAALGAMLDGQGDKVRKGAKVSLMVSDSLGALVALPWHEQLTSPDEVHGYAVACFEKQGIAIGERWAMHAQFRSYGGMGLAYALPTAWLASLVSLLEARGMQLDRVLPVTAMAYWKVAGNAKAGQELVLLREPCRTSALVYDRAGLLAMDVEPNTGVGDVALLRLLRRVAAYYPHVTSMLDWSAEAGAKPPGCIAECLPSAAVVSVDRSAWS